MPPTADDMPWIAPAPLDPIPLSRRDQTDVELRYEDIAEDGRMKVEALPHAMGVVCWRRLVGPLPGAEVLRHAGIVPILSRLVIRAGDGPFSVRHALTTDGGYDMARAVGPGGDGRLVLNLVAEMTAPLGRTHGPPPDGVGAMAFAGHVFAEHVFTRPFAPPEARKVTELPDGVWPHAFAEHAWVPGDALLPLPARATPLLAAPWAHGKVTAFGVTHTDSNQHVNSLVYPRLFEEAVLDALVAAGEGPAVLLRAVELRYRKPCFVGDRVRWHVALGRTPSQGRDAGPRFVASAVLKPADDNAAKPYCWVRGEF